MRRAARAARLGAERARFAAWARRLDLALRRAGGRLELDAPHGAHFYELPLPEVLLAGEGPGVLALRLGRDVHLGRRLVLEVFARARNEVELGDRVHFAAASRLQLRGGAIRAGADSSFRDGVLLNVSGGEIVLGRRCQLRRDSMIHANARVEMHDQAGLAERVSVVDMDHTHDGSDTFYLDQPLHVEPVSIGRNTPVYANTIIMRGARIGANAVIGANTMVRAGDYPGGVLYAGNPARAVRPLSPPAG